MEINTINLVGRAGREPDVRYFESGSIVANFTLAVNRRSRDEEPDWFNLEIWGKQAQIAADYVKKGSLIGITGSFKIDSWKDKNTGEKKEKTEWHRVVIFNEGLVNVVQQYVKKGSQVYIEGQLTTRKWKDEKSGLDRYSTEVVLQGFNSTFKILSSKNNQIENLQSSNTDKSSLPNDENTSSNDLDDEIPF